MCGMWKVVIQDKQTFKFLSETGDWNHDLSRAKNFPRIHDAAEYCDDHKVCGVHLVMGIPKDDGGFTATSRTILQVPRIHTRPPSVPRAGSDALAT
jgi:hypothetical protein